MMILVQRPRVGGRKDGGGAEAFDGKKGGTLMVRITSLGADWGDKSTNIFGRSAEGEEYDPLKGSGERTSPERNAPRTEADFPSLLQDYGGGCVQHSPRRWGGRCGRNG